MQIPSSRKLRVCAGIPFNFDLSSRSLHWIRDSLSPAALHNIVTMRWNVRQFPCLHVRPHIALPSTARGGSLMEKDAAYQFNCLLFRWLKENGILNLIWEKVKELLPNFRPSLSSSTEQQLIDDWLFLNHFRELLSFLAYELIFGLQLSISGTLSKTFNDVWI